MTVNLPNVPVWFNEGIAEYYSTFQTGGNSVKVGLPIEGHVDYLMSHPMIPLRDLFQVDRESPEYNETGRMGTFHVESWVVVHYLLNGNSAALRPRVGTFLDKLRGGVPLDH